MKRIVVLAIGVAMIVAAFFIAEDAPSQASVPQPERARVFATALHVTPTRVPTPVPTLTPIAEGVVFRGGGIELRLPQTYDSALVLHEGGSPTESTDSSFIRRLNVRYVVDFEQGFPRGVQNIRVVQVGGWFSPTEVPDVVFGVDIDSFIAEGPQRVSLGGEEAYRSVIEGLTVSDIPVTKLLYWTKRGDSYWLVIFTTPAVEFNRRLSAFEESIRTFSVQP